MFIFITTLKHPLTSDPAVVDRLAETALRSVCGQRDKRFRVIVVCNRLPNIQFSDPRITYHVVDFAAPVLPPGSPWGEHHRWDKGSKLLSGMLLARDYSPSYFGIFDADDLVSNRLVETVLAAPPCDGWFVDAGYVLNHRKKTIQLKYGLVRYCGTSLVPNAATLMRLLGAGQLTSASSQGEIADQIPRKRVASILGEHTCMVPVFAAAGAQLRPLRFPAAAWVQATGDNQNKDPGAAHGLRIDASFADEFGYGSEFGLRPNSIAEHVRERLSRVMSRVGSARLSWRGPSRAAVREASALIGNSKS